MGSRTRLRDEINMSTYWMRCVCTVCVSVLINCTFSVGCGHPVRTYNFLHFLLLVTGVRIVAQCVLLRVIERSSLGPELIRSVRLFAGMVTPIANVCDVIA